MARLFLFLMLASVALLRGGEVGGEGERGGREGRKRSEERDKWLIALRRDGRRLLRILYCLHESSHAYLTDLYPARVHIFLKIGKINIFFEAINSM